MAKQQGVRATILDALKEKFPDRDASKMERTVKTAAKHWRHVGRYAFMVCRRPVGVIVWPAIVRPLSKTSASSPRLIQ